MKSLSRSLGLTSLFLGLLLVLSSCSDGLLGGNISAQFTGINRATVLGPETISIDWITDTKCSSYQVFNLASDTTNSLTTVTIPPVVLKYPVVAGDRAYSFAVGCNTGAIVTGLDMSVPVTSWTDFNGVLNPPDTLPNQFRLSWTYPAGTGTKFNVYAIESIIPGSEIKLTMNDPISFKGYKKGYVETPLCSTYDTKMIVGQGGDCNPPAALLKAGSLYQFRVVAQYPDGNYSEDLSGHFKEKLIDSSFTPPNCTLTHQGIGAESENSYLYLRCSAGGAGANACPFNQISVRAYQGINNRSVAVSDSLTLNASGSNLLQIQPTPGLNPSNDRLIENLEVHFTCTTNNLTQTSVVRYDGTNNNPKPVLKFGNSSPNNNFEYAPEQSFISDVRAASPVIQAPSQLGSSIAIGDFDCDGHPDLAVGLPYITYHQAPYFNENAESGAVKIYYNYTMSDSGNATAANGVQFLSFRDLGYKAHFGATLSAGNINKDVYFNTSQSPSTYYSCDDLVIGAPYDGNTSIPGQAFVFFGQPQKFPQQPLNSKDLTKNAPTCSGNFDSETCSPVALSPDVVTNFNVKPSSVAQTSGTSKSSFGKQVAYVRDFDADGYGDLVVSDPDCRWDGPVDYISGVATPAYMDQVGCIYVYFGGPSGLQVKKVGKEPGTAFFQNGDFMSAFVKVYPPLPQAGMHFGASLSGGGDIDGKLPVPVTMPGGGIILAEGNDFIVGAPGYIYNNTNAYAGAAPTEPTATPFDPTGTGALKDAPDPIVAKAYNSLNTTTPTSKFTIPLNLAWAPAIASWSGNTIPTPTNTALLNSTGIAFAYLGRHAFKPYTVDLSASNHWFPIGGVPFDSVSFITSALSQYSLSAVDRQNGSRRLKLHDPSSTDVAPVNAFYNCGTRGSNTSSSSGYDHISCLAGRNNFSVIFPTLKNTDTPVSNFGSQVQVLGSKEQNAIALYNVPDSYLPSAFIEGPQPSAGVRLLMYQSQSGSPLVGGGIHDRIRGTSLWEVSIPGVDASGTCVSSTGSCNDSTSTTTTTLGSRSSLSITRAPLTETMTMTGVTTPNGGSRVQTDLNRDGYAEVVVGTALNGTGSAATASLFTYFGNFAADFAYTATLSAPYSSSANCTVSRPTATESTSAGTATTAPASAIGKIPFATFQSKVFNTGGSSQAVHYTAEHPIQAFYTDGALTAFIDGTVTANGFGYVDRPTSAEKFIFGNSPNQSSCQPQVRTFNAAPQSMAAADLDFDGLTDLAVGFSAYASNQGKGSVFYAGSNGIGLGMEQVITTSDSNGYLGSAIGAVNWKFISPANPNANPAIPVIESFRRDLWIGANGRNASAGAVYNFKSAGSAVSQVVPSVNGSENPFTDQSNSPNALLAERSRIIGDINGDSFDDILVPVKRMDNGSTRYDGIIYFGSSLGPVTNSFCKNNLSQISYQLNGGSSISAADCFGSSTSVIAYMSKVKIRLPQYLQMPSGVTGSWLLNVFQAGDVNQDGKKDIVAFDNGKLYLFFGSDGGLVNGQPTMGLSSNGAPQLVTRNATIYKSLWEAHVTDFKSGDNGLFTKPVVHGDFNGDGYEDLAFALTDLNSPYHVSPTASPSWSCTAAYLNINSGYRGYCLGGSPLAAHGAVVVIYGGPNGYQVPSGGQDFALTSLPTCNDFMESCTGLPANTKEVYGSLKYFSGTKNYQISSQATCDRTSNGVPGASCGTSGSGVATIIRNPIFYDIDNGNVITSERDFHFGASLTVGDFNGDGVDDLIVGAPNHYAYYYGDSNFATRFSGGTTSSFSAKNIADAAEPDRNGSVFIYYGSNAGVLAPNVKDMLLSNGLGLDSTSSTTGVNRDSITFALNPLFYKNSWPSGYGTRPELDASASGTVDYRRFGMSVTTGDFNGDGMADLAVSSYNGQIYVYYGPFCQTDNLPAVWKLASYSYHDLARSWTDPNVAPNSTISSALDCKVPTFYKMLEGGISNPNLPASTSTADSKRYELAAPTQKNLHPQMIYIDGTNAGMRVGSALLSAMPGKGGNMNGDSADAISGPSSGTSDLMIGAYASRDPNVPTVSGNETGMGYVLFGHPQLGGSFTTTPGLFWGTSSYNGSISVSTSGTNQFFHYSPVTLKPYPSDGTVSSFFLYPNSMGDLNGDGSGDLLLPTHDLKLGGDRQTPVISGGGFKLVY